MYDTDDRWILPSKQLLVQSQLNSVKATLSKRFFQRCIFFLFILFSSAKFTLHIYIKLQIKLCKIAI